MAIFESIVGALASAAGSAIAGEDINFGRLAGDVVEGSIKGAGKGKDSQEPTVSSADMAKGGGIGDGEGQDAAKTMSELWEEVKSDGDESAGGGAPRRDFLDVLTELSKIAMNFSSAWFGNVHGTAGGGPVARAGQSASGQGPRYSAKSPTSVDTAPTAPLKAATTRQGPTEVPQVPQAPQVAQPSAPSGWDPSWAPPVPTEVNLEDYDPVNNPLLNPAPDIPQLFAGLGQYFNAMNGGNMRPPAAAMNPGGAGRPGFG